MRRLGVFLIAGSLISVIIESESRRYARSNHEAESREDEIKTSDKEIPNFENPPDEELPIGQLQAAKSKKNSKKNIIIFGRNEIESSLSPENKTYDRDENGDTEDGDEEGGDIKGGDIEGRDKEEGDKEEGDKEGGDIKGVDKEGGDTEEGDKEDGDKEGGHIKGADPEDDSSSGKGGQLFTPGKLVLKTQTLKEKDIYTISTRPLQAGDIFTPENLVPITQRLINKVENPGEGHGIVSSEKNPFALADTLFRAYFGAASRIVTLADRDIAGLDAFQALALSGGEVLRTSDIARTEATYPMKHEGQYISVIKSPRKSRYSLLDVPIAGNLVKSKNKKMVRKPHRKGIARRNRSDKLAKKLGKKRELIVNPAHKNSRNRRHKTRVLAAEKDPVKLPGQFEKGTKKHTTVETQSERNYGTPVPPLVDKSFLPNPKNHVCRWRYVCAEPTDLDTCRLRTHCVMRNRKSAGDKDDYIGPIQSQDQQEILKSFRRMAKIYPVDEEVEKIIEVRLMQIRPQRPDPPKRIQTLEEYFNEIIISEYRSTQTTRYDGSPTTEPVRPDSEDAETKRLEHKMNKPDNEGFPEKELKREGYGTKWIYFPDGNGEPRRVTLTMPYYILPMRSGKTNKIEYRFYSRDRNCTLDSSGRSQQVDEDVIRKSIANKLVKVVTHGWWSSADNSVVVGITNAYLKTQDLIVIAVNWADTAKDVYYPRVAHATADVGSKVGKFLIAFCNRYKVRPERLHLIGHSLGAHVMGVAGQISGLNVSRITGLDPARPLFESPYVIKSNNKKLDLSDAQFVDVIHTCAGALGYKNPIGHADYFPNNGISPQPGCSGNQFFKESCSHSRSYEYFEESIYSPRAFPACLNGTNACRPETYMGDSVNRQASGKYYLQTNPQTPSARSRT